MTITIPDTIAQDVIAVFGQAIARSPHELTKDIYRDRVSVFISALEPNAQEPGRWLLDETVKIWSGGQ